MRGTECEDLFLEFRQGAVLLLGGLIHLFRFLWGCNDVSRWVPEQVCVCVSELICSLEEATKHEEGGKETKTHWEPILDQGLEVGVVTHILQRRKLRFRKTLALDTV